MVVDLMSDFTNKILVQMGWPHAVMTGLTSGTSVKPGMAVTNTDEASADSNLVRALDAADEVPLGIAGCNTEHDIDTAYPAGSVFPVYLKGGGHVVWARLDDSMTILKGGQLDAVSPGDVAVGTEANLIEEIGYAYSYQASVAGDKFLMIFLG